MACDEHAVTGSVVKRLAKSRPLKFITKLGLMSDLRVTRKGEAFRLETGNTR